MRIPLNEVHLALNGLQVPGATRSQLHELVEADAARIPSGSPTNVTGIFPCPGEAAGQFYESRSLEAGYMALLRYSRNAIFFKSQPISLKVSTEFEGKTRSSRWTPDLLVIEREAVYLIECKPLEKLAAMAEKTPWKVQENEDRTFSMPLHEKLCSDLGYNFKLITELDIPGVLQANLRWLMDFRESDFTPSRTDRRLLKKLVTRISKKGPLRVSEILSEDLLPPTTLYFAIAHGQLHTAMHLWPVYEADNCLIFDSEESLAHHIDYCDNADGDYFVPAKKPSTNDASFLERASPKDIETANARLDILNGTVATLPNGSTPKPRTIRLWNKAYRESVENGLPGIAGLIPRRGGNRNRRITGQELHVIEEFVEQYYSESTPDFQEIYNRYSAHCTSNNVCPVSETTFRSEVKAGESRESLRERHGTRALNKTDPFIYWLDRPDPVHGTRPWAVCHLDHTLLDIELIDLDTGVVLGRPWLSLLVDAHTRRVLVAWLTFSNPSAETCLSIMAECVRRWRRLPDILVVDRGSDLSSRELRFFCNLHDIELRIRPTAKARFGSIVERVFGKTNKSFVHSLVGNTKLMKAPREVSSTHNPKNLALWTFSEFDRRLQKYATDVYERLRHPALGQSPRDFWNWRTELAGKRKNRSIVFDFEFYLTSLPHYNKEGLTPRKDGTIDLHKITYTCHELQENNPRKKVPVKYDPTNAGHIYAYLDGRWICCRSTSYAYLSDLSVKEAQYITATIWKQLDRNSRADMADRIILGRMSLENRNTENELRESKKRTITKSKLTEQREHLKENKKAPEKTHPKVSLPKSYSPRHHRQSPSKDTGSDD